MNPTRDAAAFFVQHVLHPTDFSAASERAFAHALAIALMRGSRLTLLHAAPNKDAAPAWTEFPGVRAMLERWKLLQPGSPKAAVREQLGLRVRKQTVANGDPTEAIVEYLDREPCDLIVLATGGREGLARVRDGSVAEAIARRSRTMTLFVPSGLEREIVSMEDGHLSLANVLVPIDHDPAPDRAIEFARRAAGTFGDGNVSVTLLHVGEPSSGPDVAVENGAGCVFERMQRTGDPVEQILDAAKSIEADLIVMSTAGHQGVFDALRGSTTERVLRGAPCPLLAVPAGGGR